MVSNINSTTAAQKIKQAEARLGRKLTKAELTELLNPPKKNNGKGTTVKQTTALKPKALAQKFKASAEKYWGAVDTDEFQNLLKNVDKNNVIDLLKEYDKISPDESFIEMICDEKGNSSDERKAAISNIFNKLLAKAEEAGVDVSHFKNNFNTDLNYQFRKIGFTDTKKLDEIVNSLIQATENKQQLTAADRAEITNTPLSKHHTTTDQMLANRINSAQKSFNNQLKQDGWAGDVADFAGKLYGSKNTADNIRKDLKLAKNQFAQLEAAKKQGGAAYEAKFREIFGTEFDPQSIKVYEKKEKVYAEASAHHSLEEYYKDQSSYFLNRKGLSAEYTTMPGTVPVTVQTASKEQVYARETKKFANFLGEDGQKVLADALKNAGLENADIDKKFAFVQNMAKDIASQLHKNTLKAGGGKEFNQVQHEYEYSYKAAFGVKNDIMKRVNEYNLSQQAGAGAVKAAVVVGATVAAAFTGGSSLAVVAGVTAGATVATEVTDKFTSGEVIDTLKSDGLAAAIKKGNENTNYTEIFKQAVVSGGMVLVGGGVAKGVQFASKGLTTVQQAAAMFGADVVTGMGAEKLMTGEITVGGTIFNVLLSGAGNIVAVKMAAKAAAAKPKAMAPRTFDRTNIAEVRTARPEELLRPTKADNIAGQGISFRQAPDQPVYRCTKIEWGKTVEETIALNRKNGINIELVKDADGSYYMGIKDIWTEGGYHRIDRNSAVMQYGKYPKTDQYVDQAWAARNADADGNIMDCAVIANDKGAQILENSYITETGQKIDFATMEPGTPVRKDPNATVNAVAYDSPQQLTTLEGPITTDITMGDVDGNVYNNFKQLKKQITKGQLVPNEADPNSARFIELIKAGDDDAAIALLKEVSSTTPTAAASRTAKISPLAKCELPSSMEHVSGEIGNVTVKIANGDMTQIKADAYIVPQFQSCASFGGVGGAIARRGAEQGLQAFEDIISQQGKQPFGSVHLTDSYGGNSKKLLHAVSVGSGAENEFNTVQTAVYNALKAAEENGLQSVAVPAMGTGIIGSLTEEQSAKAIMAAIKQFSDEGGKMDVSMVIYGSKKGYNDFANTLSAKSYTNATAQTGTKEFDTAKWISEMHASLNPVETNPSMLPKVITEEVNRNLTDVQRANMWRYGNAKPTEISPAIRQNVTEYMENMLGKPLKPENLIANKTDKGSYLAYYDDATGLTTCFTNDGRPNGQWLINLDAAGNPTNVEVYSIYHEGKFWLR